MDRCANTEALARFEEENVKTELASDVFFKNVEPRLAEIAELVECIYEEATYQEGYDFTEYAKELLEDLI